MTSLDTHSQTHSVAAPAKPSPPGVPPAKILVVDDNPDNVRLLSAFLNAEGHQTLEATDGPSARETAVREMPDLILLDIMMPGETGVETCTKLKEDPRTSEIPIIFQSALGDTDDKVLGFAAGCVDYVVKPIRRAEVLARVRAHLKIHFANRLLLARHQQWLATLQSAQKAILSTPSDVPEACFGVCYQPLEEASGDFYDVFPVGDQRVTYFVADISGHGASAAFLTSALKATLRQHAHPSYAPEDILHGIDLVMRQMLGEEQYVTACLVDLDREARRISILSAGHPAAIVLQASGEVTKVEADGCPIGAFDSLVLHRYTTQASMGDRVILYTDGLVEAAPGAGRSEGIAWLAEACRRRQHSPISLFPNEIVAELRSLRPASDDDVLLLAFEVTP